MMEYSQENSRKLENNLNTAGYGFFHVLVILVAGMANAADTVEIFGVSFILPIANEDLDLSTARKGYIDASIFIALLGQIVDGVRGMLLGSYIWGSLADVFGRRRTLLVVMLINGVCGLVAAFSPNYFIFICFRIAGGIGVGGSQPIIYSYVSEFFTEMLRGPMIIILTCFWSSGIFFTALLAWGMLGRDIEISFYIGSLHMVDWRVFLAICTVPAFASSLSILFLPETPAYLFQDGEQDQLKKVLKTIHRVNSACYCCWYRPVVTECIPLMNGVNGVNGVDDPEKTKEQINDEKRRCSLLSTISSKMKVIGINTLGLFGKRYIRTSFLLLLIWFTVSFSYFGLQLWFPELFKRLLSDSCNETAVWTNCSNETSLQYYQTTLYTAVATSPGYIAGILLINFLGGRILLVFSLLLTSLSVVLIWVVTNEIVAVVIVSCVFTASTGMVTGALDFVVINLYDTDSRVTSYGFFIGIERIGAILGNVMFGYFLDMYRAIPFFIVSLLLAVGAIATIFLPQVYRPENLPPLEKAISTSKLCKKKCY